MVAQLRLTSRTEVPLPSGSVGRPCHRAGRAYQPVRLVWNAYDPATGVPAVGDLDNTPLMALSIRDFTRNEAMRVSSWSYPPPFDIYNGDPDDSEMFLARCEEGYGYYAVADENDEVVGFCCYGPEARVKGQDAEAGTLDIGGGVRPDLVSQGIATHVFPAVMQFGTALWRPERFRTAVASFNERSKRLCTSAGFGLVRTFDGP